MHIPTHILSGWCVASVLKLTPRERFFAMVAAAVADVDGIGKIISENLYQDLHHKLGHNVFFAIVVSIVLTIFSTHRVKAFALYLLLTHVHLLLDYYGSGPGWPIWYLWPVNDFKFKNENAWEFFSWQNISAGYGMVALTFFLSWKHRRTPLEFVMPSLDHKLVTMLHRRPPDDLDTSM